MSIIHLLEADSMFDLTRSFFTSLNQDMASLALGASQARARVVSHPLAMVSAVTQREISTTL